MAVTSSSKPKCTLPIIATILYREDMSKVMVKIARDFYVELKQEEALQYIGKKEKVLNRKIEALSDKAA